MAQQSNEYRRLLALLDQASDLAYIVSKQEVNDEWWMGNESLDIEEKLRQIYISFNGDNRDAADEIFKTNLFK